MSKKKKKNKTSDLLLSKRPPIERDELSRSQKEAYDLYHDWFFSRKSADKQVLRIGGLAGCGKSFLIRYILEQMGFDEDECYVVAYTGQAVNVLRHDGILAKTIHSTFMHSTEVPVVDKDGDPIYRSGVPLMQLKFSPIKHIPSSVELIIVDESSFLPKSLEKLLKSYGTPILEMGDPIQLPPVAGEQCFNMSNLDYFMTDIMRQNEGSEIIDLATKIRNYEPIRLSDYGREVKFLWAQDSPEDTFFRFRPFFKGSNIIISSTNKQRDVFTELYRKHIVKTESPFPLKGERLICRKNDWGLKLGMYPLTNGTIGTAVHTVGKSEVDFTSGTFTLDFRPDFSEDKDYFDGLLCDTKFLRSKFGNKDMSYYEKLNPGKKFEFAYVTTCQLAQGGGYPTVMFLDSHHRDAEYHMRVRYTAATRARETLYYMLPTSKYPHWTDLTFGGFRP